MINTSMTHDGGDGPSRIRILGHASAAEFEVLTPGAVSFVAALERRFRRARAELLELRRDRPSASRPQVAARASGWSVGPDLRSLITALNALQDSFVVDLGHPGARSWSRVIEGQRNLRDVVHRRIGYSDRRTGQRYVTSNRVTSIRIRPRAWGDVERHLLVDSEPVSATLFDVGLFLFHNVDQLRCRAGSGEPWLCPPGEPCVFEERLWADVVEHAQLRLEVPCGTIPGPTGTATSLETTDRAAGALVA